MDKSKGQHILRDVDVLKKELAEAEISSEDKIIEIGAGTGFLTKELVKKAKKVIAFEIDKEFKINLNTIAKENKNLYLVYDDALKYSWKGYNKIVANIPYQLSEQTILKSIEDNIGELILIVGENFKEILESNETKMGIHTKLFYDFKPIMKVTPECFHPSPRVDSWLIKLKQTLATKETKLLREILLKKGKIKNAILSSLISEGKTKKQARELVEKLNLTQAVLEKPVRKITGNLLIRLRKELR